MILLPSPYQEMFLITTFGIFLICQICIDIMVVSLPLFDESLYANFILIPILGVIKSGMYCIAILLHGLFVIDESLPFPTFVMIWMMTAIVSIIFLWAINAISQLFFDFKGVCV